MFAFCDCKLSKTSLQLNEILFVLLSVSVNCRSWGKLHGLYVSARSKHYDIPVYGNYLIPIIDVIRPEATALKLLIFQYNLLWMTIVMFCMFVVPQWNVCFLSMCNITHELCTYKILFLFIFNCYSTIFPAGKS